MDLKIPSQLPGLKPAPAPIGDLLNQLRAAGTVEAEVIKLLKDNQLLLSSRLGQILTSNALKYRVGDRVNLRLDESSGQAVLKASPPLDKPLKLDSREYPQLTRVLPRERPLLALVVGNSNGKTEIRLAEQIVRLPRELTLPKNQLLSLQRRDQGRSIEIRQLPNKTIYKALLQQLLPRQAQAREPALIRLIEFARSTSEKPQAANAQPATTPQRQVPPGADQSRVAIPSESRQIAANSMTAKPAPGPQSAVVAATPAVPARAIPGVIEPTRSPTVPKEGSITAARSAVPGGKAAKTMPPASRTATRANPVVAGGNANPAGGTARTSQPVTAPAVLPRSDSAVNTAPGQGRPGAGPAGESPKVDIGNTSKSTSGHKAQAAAPATPAKATAAMPANASVAIPPTPGLNFIATSPLPSLQPLLQLVSTLAGIDAPQIKKWFEFARLVRGASNSTASAPAGDIFRLLQPLEKGDSLARDLAQANLQKPFAGKDAEAAAPKANAQEPQLAQLREFSRLAEQSLSQNLLQRASIGLQQETQQPLNLSLALPFFDQQQQLKPVYIDLEQRKQGEAEADRSWEIRLSFELGGLGCISCHLLLEGQAVAASFYSENESTRASIEAELPQLRRQLINAGFDPGEFHSFPGKPSQARQPGAADFSEALIDLEA